MENITPSDNTPKRLFLLDAYALIYRAYYAFIKNPRFNSKGMNTSAILGFVNTLEEVLKKETPTHIAVVFDPSGPTFRHEAYEQYKAQREETPEDIRKAVPIIKEVVEAYHIPVLQVAGFEADDVIGTLAKKAAAVGYDVYMRNVPFILHSNTSGLSSGSTQYELPVLLITNPSTVMFIV